MMKRIGVFAILGLLFGCSNLLKGVVEEPKVSLARVEVGSVELSRSTLLFVLKVENPNGVSVKVDEVNYKVFLQEKAFTSGKRAEPVTVPAKGQIEVPLPLVVEHKSLWSNLGELFSSKTLSYRVEGDARISAFRIPFETKGKVDLQEK